MNSSNRNNIGKKKVSNTKNIKRKSTTNIMPKNTVKRNINTSNNIKKSNIKKKSNKVKSNVNNNKKSNNLVRKQRPKSNIQSVKHNTNSNNIKRKKNIVHTERDEFDELFLQDVEDLDLNNLIDLINNTDENTDEETLDYVEIPKKSNNVSNIKNNKKRKSNSNSSNNKMIVKEEEKRRVSPLAIVMFSFAIAFVIGALYLMFNLDFFNLTDIKVTGNTKYDSETIIKNTSLNIGNNVFKSLLSKGYIVSEIPYVSSIKYKYRFPSTIVLAVEERYPEYIAKDKDSGKYYMLDNKGYILEECQGEKREDTLYIEGLEFGENVGLGTQIDENYLKKIQKYKEIKELLEEENILTNITKVNFQASLTIITIDDKLNVVFSNDSNLRYRVSFLKSIINQNGSTIEEGTIDMSLENPIYSKYD